MRRRRAGLPTRRPPQERKHCSFCWQPATKDRIVIDGGHASICADCAVRVLKMVAAQRPPIEDDEAFRT
jgi:hypothetical protein